MMSYDDYKRLSGLISRHEEEMDRIDMAIGNFMAICDIAKKEFYEKHDWAMANIDQLREKKDLLRKEYIKECEAVYGKYRSGENGIIKL